MLGSGSAGNSALIATDHCKILVDGGLSARQLVLRLELCGVAPEQLDGVLSAIVAGILGSEQQGQLTHDGASPQPRRRRSPPLH